MSLARAIPLALVMAGSLLACSREEVDVLPENMTEENLPAVETVQEEDSDVDVVARDVGADAVAVPVGTRP